MVIYAVYRVCHILPGVLFEFCSRKDSMQGYLHVCVENVVFAIHGGREKEKDTNTKSHWFGIFFSTDDSSSV